MFASPNCSKTPALAVLLLACAPVGRHAVQAPKFCCITSCSPSVERYDTGPHTTQRTWPSATTPTQRASSCLTQCCSQCTADGTQVTHTLCPLVMPTHSGPACRTSCSQCFFCALCLPIVDAFQTLRPRGPAEKKRNRRRNEPKCEDGEPPPKNASGHHVDDRLLQPLARCADETSIFRELGLSFVPPSMRILKLEG